MWIETHVQSVFLPRIRRKLSGTFRMFMEDSGSEDLTSPLRCSKRNKHDRYLHTYSHVIMLYHCRRLLKLQMIFLAEYLCRNNIKTKWSPKLFLKHSRMFRKIHPIILRETAIAHSPIEIVLRRLEAAFWLCTAVICVCSRTAGGAAPERLLGHWPGRSRVSRPLHRQLLPGAERVRPVPDLPRRLSGRSGLRRLQAIRPQNKRELIYYTVLTSLEDNSDVTGGGNLLFASAAIRRTLFYNGEFRDSLEAC